MSDEDDRTRRWAVRLDRVAAAQHREWLAATVAEIQIPPPTPLTMGGVWRDLEERRAAAARLERTRERAELLADVTIACRRGWWTTMRLLARQLVGVEVV